MFVSFSYILVNSLAIKCETIYQSGQRHDPSDINEMVGYINHCNYLLTMHDRYIVMILKMHCRWLNYTYIVSIRWYLEHHTQISIVFRQMDGKNAKLVCCDLPKSRLIVFNTLISCFFSISILFNRDRYPCKDKSIPITHCQRCWTPLTTFFYFWWNGFFNDYR